MFPSACRVVTNQRGGWGLALVWQVVGLLPVTEVGARLVWVGTCAGVWHGECCFVCEVDIMS